TTDKPWFAELPEPDLIACCWSIEDGPRLPQPQPVRIVQKPRFPPPGFRSTARRSAAGYEIVEIAVFALDISDGALPRVAAVLQLLDAPNSGVFAIAEHLRAKIVCG